MDDHELVSRHFADGCEDALADLVRRHSGLVYSVCLRMLNDQHAAEDATQAVFIALVRKPRRFGSNSALLAWLYRVAQCSALQLRRERAARARREREVAEMKAREAIAGEHEQLWDEMRPVLDEAVASLPARYRDPVILHYLAGKPQEEVARELGCPRQTVATRLARAVRKLQAKLSGRDVSVGVALLATFLGQRSAEATPAHLAGAITAVCTGKAVAPATVLGVAKGALKMMFWAKVKLAAGILLAASVVAGTGSGLIAAQFGGPKEDARSPGAAPRAAAPEVILAKGGKATLPIYVAAGPLAEALQANAGKSQGELGKRLTDLGHKRDAADRGKKPDEAKTLEGEMATLMAVCEARGWADDLERCLNRMSGDKFDLKLVEKFPAKPGPGIYVGEAGAFDWGDIPKDLAEEELILRTRKDSQVLVAGGSRYGVSHAVYTLLDKLGCRWFFPGEAWEVIPRRPDIAVALDERQKPDFPIMRSMWYGGDGDPVVWSPRNRLSPIENREIGETWFGLNRDKDFKEHPDWFAEVGGKRQASKPCYTNPEVIQKGIEYVLKRAATGKRMISLTPPDWIGFCECERCRAMLKGGKERRIQFEGGNLLFADMPDGQLAGLTSETVFNFVNKVAEEVGKKYPDVFICCLAYSHHGHPPTFDLRPNVYVPVAQTMRWSPLSNPQTAEVLAKKKARPGVYAYYDVYTWFKDGPGPKNAGSGNLEWLVRTVNEDKKHGVEGYYTEMSNNWGAQGLGYYMAARLWWDTESDTETLMRDFFDKAFGPAAEPMKKYYTQFWGPPRKIAAEGEIDLTQHPYLVRFTDWGGGIRVKGMPDGLQNTFNYLGKAAELVKDMPEYLARVDQIRMYFHYLFVLRKNVEDADKAKDEQKIIEAVKEETVFAARLLDTGMIHSWVLLGEGFYDRFGKYKGILSKVPEANIVVWQANEMQYKDKPAWRRARSDVPTHEEMEKIWAADKAALGY